MLTEALEYFRNLENVVFTTEYDNGEDWEDHRSFPSGIAYRSIDQLIQDEQIPGKKLEVVKNDENEEGLGSLYSLTFVTDRNSPEIVKLREKLEKLEQQIWGSGKDAYAAMNEKQQIRKHTKYDKVFSDLCGLENDHSSTSVLVLELK